MSAPIFLELLDDGRLFTHYVCLDCGPEHHLGCRIFPDPIKFLERYEPNLQGYPQENAIHRLAEHLNYPLCKFVDMIEAGKKKRALAEANQASETLIPTLEDFN